MKKLLLAVLACFVFTSLSYGTNADLFELDESKINAEFAELNELETYVSMNENVTIHNIYEENAGLVNGMNLSYGPEGMMGQNGFSIDNFEWGSFAWGLCCWPVGIFTVLINDSKGNDHKISYLIGVGSFLLLGGSGFGIFF
ncbi:hypothetical protein SAMN05661096_03259 [Marivirga sericea]|uniref:Uncharacterized protein n=1 Tax=Marivirga sericea TaxID=1028 RepID=A0A1X7KZK9_9BACT|nr:hypothetical protein [Marivirga sericea]SMG46319.1 hypothetical protein SAMN05661096_03259 [Marivirga sericea]